MKAGFLVGDDRDAARVVGDLGEADVGAADLRGRLHRGHAVLIDDVGLEGADRHVLLVAAVAGAVAPPGLTAPLPPQPSVTEVVVAPPVPPVPAPPSPPVPSAPDERGAKETEKREENR
ncbi:MAG: hypothetical protein R3F14_06555 [Polyangiaceae bacterium]